MLFWGYLGVTLSKVGRTDENTINKGTYNIQLIKKNELTTQELIKVMVIIINKKKEDTLNSDYTTGNNNPIDSVSKKPNKQERNISEEEMTILMTTIRMVI